MKKFLKILFILIAIGAVLYLVYLFVMMPDEHNDPANLARDYFENIERSDICETHFNPETISVCESLQTDFDGEEIVIDSITKLGESIIVTISIGDNDDIFIVTFIDEDVSGVKGFFNKKTYLIDLITG